VSVRVRPDRVRIYRTHALTPLHHTVLHSTAVDRQHSVPSTVGQSSVKTFTLGADHPKCRAEPCTQSNNITEVSLPPVPAIHASILCTVLGLRVKCYDTIQVSILFRGKKLLCILYLLACKSVIVGPSARKECVRNPHLLKYVALGNIECWKMSSVPL
jgi:hypothetical protein